MDYLIAVDRQALLAINSWHTAYLDQLMWLVSGKFSWTLIAVALLAALWQDGRRAILTIAAIGLTILIADQVSSGIIKHWVERPRPTHEPDLQGLVHMVNGYRGGHYGFVSSHAANSFGVAALIALIARQRSVALAMSVWAVMQCYSRMYLGVHYPGDIIGGTLVGLIAAGLVYALWQHVSRRKNGANTPQWTRTQAHTLAGSVYLTVIILAIMAIFTY